MGTISLVFNSEMGFLDTTSAIYVTKKDELLRIVMQLLHQVARIVMGRRTAFHWHN